MKSKIRPFFFKLKCGTRWRIQRCWSTSNLNSRFKSQFSSCKPFYGKVKMWTTYRRFIKVNQPFFKSLCCWNVKLMAQKFLKGGYLHHARNVSNDLSSLRIWKKGRTLICTYILHLVFELYLTVTFSFFFGPYRPIYTVFMW